MGETRALEGRLIAAQVAKTGSLPRWNCDPGRIPPVLPGPDDVTLKVATGEIDLLLQARRTIRQLAAEPLVALFEEHHHAVRMLAVGNALRGGVLSDEAIRSDLPAFPAPPEIRDEILSRGYLDQPCPSAPRADRSDRLSAPA